MKRAYLFVIAAVLGVIALLYIATGSTSDRSGRRGTQAEREAKGAGANSDTAESPKADMRSEVQLEGTVRVEVRVIDGGDAIVEIRGPESWTGRANADGGAFRGFLPSGTYTVCARLKKTAAARTFRVAKVPVIVELELSLAIVVSGTVSQPDGSPIAGATLTAFPESERKSANPRWNIAALSVNAHPPVFGSTLSDREGKYALLLPFTGLFTIKARAARYGGTNSAPRRFEQDAEGVDFVLQKGEPVSGRVVDAEKNGVPGAMVVVSTRPRGQSVVTIAYTNENGEFHADVPPTGTARLSVRAHGYAPTMFGRVTPPVHGLEVAVSRGGTATVHVIIADTNGQPAVGVEGMLSFDGGARTAVSDENGNMRFGHVSGYTDAETWRSLVLAGNGFVPRVIDIFSSRAESGTFDLGQQEVEVGGTVRGRVTDAVTGSGISGVGVLFWNAASTSVARYPITGAVSGPDGSYELAGVPADITAILGSKTGYAQDVDRAALWEKRSDPKAALFAPGQRLLVHDFQLLPAAVTRGRVIDHEGNGVSGVNIQGTQASILLPARGNPRPMATTDEDGHFALSGYRNGQKIRLITARHPTLGISTVADVTAGSDDEIEIVYAATTRVVGRVVGPDGAAVVGAGVKTVAVEPARSPNRPVGVTDKQGRFVLRGVEGGSRRIQIDHGQFRLTKTLVTIVTGQEEFDVGEFRMEVGNTIAGVLVDENGDPIAGRTIRLNFRPPEGFDRTQAGGTERTRATCSSGLDGRFFIAGLKAGEFRLTAEVPGKFTNRPVVRTGTTDARIAVREGRVWEGFVVFAGQPVNGAWVNLRMAGERAPIASAVSDAKGKIVLSLLPPEGAVDIEIEHNGFLPLKMTAIAVDGLPREVVLDRGLTLSGRVVDRAGTPIEGVEVFARDAPDGETLKNESSAKDGTFTFGGLQAKPYEVSIFWTNQRHVLPDAITAKPNGLPIYFRLEEGRTIAGKIAWATAKGGRFVHVTAIDRDGKIRSDVNVIVGRPPEFKLEGLAAGTFTIRVTKGFGEDAPILAEIPDVKAPSTGLVIEISD